MINYAEAFKRPFQDVVKLLLGIVLYILPIVNLLALGYMLRAAKSAMKKDYTMPEWQDWGDLFIKGLLAAVIGIIYSIPIIILIGVFGGAAIASAVAGGFSEEAIIIALMSIGIGLAVIGIVALITWYIVPLALMSYITNWKFSDAFKFSNISKKAFTSTYFVTWLLVGVYCVVVSGILSFVPIVGGAIAGFITGTTALTAIAEAYSQKK